MTRFLRIFLRDRLDQSVQLAGFGKHPAWDDHIDDLGLTTETLVIIRRILYSEGIGSLVSAGAWNRLEERGQAVGFDHRFVWSRETQAVVGGIWASSDGKGRARFPMIVCLQVGVNGWRAVHSFLPEVEDLGALCKLAKDQQKFRDTFADLQRRLSSNALGDSGSGVQVSNLAEERKQAILDGMVALAQGLKTYRKRGARDGERSIHFRLPAISNRTKESLEFWAGYLETRIGLPVPCLTIASAGLGPVDVIAGEPHAQDFFCLRAAEKTLPMSRAFAGAKDLPDAELEAKVYLRSFELGSMEPPGNRQVRRWWPFQ
ncbi:MAG: hypothetical protein JOZ31_21740 [Verrucomicrobia bacterium]|nr:hypothetical protein [Verrucomicrobiota bacterium]MBV8483151.1 hypothetical protein [Verrucomicrobiota bacterium]